MTRGRGEVRWEGREGEGGYGGRTGIGGVVRCKGLLTLTNLIKVMSTRTNKDTCFCEEAVVHCGTGARHAVGVSKMS